jgi:hypothetical protein
MGIKFALNDDDKMYLTRAYPAESVTRDDFSIGLQLMLQAADDFSITINAMPDILKEVTAKVQETVDSSKENSARSSLKPKFCTYCGASITPTHIYCPQCGRKIE